MENDSNTTHRELAHYHACVHCGSLSRRDEFDGAAVATGVYPCPKCGLDGPLNLVIQDVNATATGTRDSTSSNSAG